MKRNDLILLAGLLILAGLLWLALRPGGAEGGWAVITRDGREAARVPLGEERSFTLTGAEGGYNRFRVENGAIRAVDADCGDQTCVRMGPISREGETIVCLPHRLIVEIEGVPADFDAAAR